MYDLIALPNGDLCGNFDDPVDAMSSVAMPQGLLKTWRRLTGVTPFRLCGVTCLDFEGCLAFILSLASFPPLTR